MTTSDRHGRRPRIVWAQALGALAGLYGAAGVGLAAVGAHNATAPAITTAAHFLLFHAAALTGLCAIGQGRQSIGILIAASLLACGTFFFSGELAFHALTGIGVLSIAAPSGGMLMIAGWLAAAIAIPMALRKPPDPS